MIIVMGPGHTDQEREAVIERIEKLGYKVHPIYGVERTVIAAVGREDKTPLASLEQMAGVESAIPILKPFKLASAEWKKEPTVFKVGDATIGGNEIVVIAGPGVVEDEQQMIEAARAAKTGGARLFRGSVFSHYMSPYETPGPVEDKIELLGQLREETGLAIVTEVFSVREVDTVAELADVIQIGARNCQNYSLLRVVGRLGKPVFLKRGMSTTIKEFLMAAEYVLSEGNPQVILCERGIRTFAGETRFTLDLNAVPAMRRQCHLPIFVDPSHGTGRRKLVAPMSRAAVAAGCDGLMIEVHPEPNRATIDGAQSLRPDEFAALMVELRRIAAAVDRKL